jgi:hypothetical protein
LPITSAREFKAFKSCRALLSLGWIFFKARQYNLLEGWRNEAVWRAFARPVKPAELHVLRRLRQWYLARAAPT